jgi:ATPase family protein associated with various cellular activities (AAA)
MTTDTNGPFHEAHSLLTELDYVDLADFSVVGSYARYENRARQALRDAVVRIANACRTFSNQRENYLIWAAPGTGKTYLVQQIAAQLRDSVHYEELNLAKFTEEDFRTRLKELLQAGRPVLCLIDEVDAKADDSWPYEMLLPCLDSALTDRKHLVFVFVGSSGSDRTKMKEFIEHRPKGKDLLSRIPQTNEVDIPPLSIGDRLLVVLSQFNEAAGELRRQVREVEKFGLLYIAITPFLGNPRQLREFAVGAVQRVGAGDDRVKYDHLFASGNSENKEFWEQYRLNANNLWGSYLTFVGPKTTSTEQKEEKVDAPPHGEKLRQGDLRDHLAAPIVKAAVKCMEEGVGGESLFTLYVMPVGSPVPRTYGIRGAGNIALAKALAISWRAMRGELAHQDIDTWRRAAETLSELGVETTLPDFWDELLLAVRYSRYSDIVFESVP